MCCSHLISKTVWQFFKKVLFIYKFLCQCYVCYIGHTTQRLDIRMNQHILSNIHTNTLDYTTASSNQNWSSTIAHHLLDDPFYSTMFTILEISSNEFCLSILESLLITKYQPTLCIQKRFYTLLLFNNPTLPQEENNITHANSSGLQ